MLSTNPRLAPNVLGTYDWPEQKREKTALVRPYEFVQAWRADVTNVTPPVFPLLITLRIAVWKFGKFKFTSLTVAAPVSSWLISSRSVELSGSHAPIPSKLVGIAQLKPSPVGLSPKVITS